MSNGSDATEEKVDQGETREVEPAETEPGRNAKGLAV